MRCIHCQSPHLPSLPHLKYKHQLTTPKQHWLSTYQPSHLIQSQHISRPLPLTTRPISTVSPALGFDAPANTGDLSVFIQTSAVLFFVYWLANFVVPDIISRHLGLDRGGESEKPNGNNPFDDEKR